MRGCAVTAATAMNVSVAPGTVAAPTLNNTGTVLCVSDAAEIVTLTSAPATGNWRYDLIICRPRGADLDGGTDNDFIFDKVTGTASTSTTPAVPGTPAGTVCLARVYIPGGTATIPSTNILDVRPQMGSGPRGTLAEQKWTANSPGSTGSQVWFNAPAAVVDGTRRIKISFAGVLQGTAGDLASLELRDGSTQIAEARAPIMRTGTTGQHSVCGLWEGVPAGGPHTYFIDVNLLSGTGPVTGAANATVPAFILVEDIGI